MALEKMRGTPASIQGLRDLIKVTHLVNFHMAEIGSYAGESTSIFLDCGAASILAVDAWGGTEGTDQYSPRRAELVFDKKFNSDSRVVKLKARSEEAAATCEPSAFDLLYIDAAHTFPAVVRYVQEWLHTITPYGFIAGHDLSGGWPGVKLALDLCLTPFLGEPFVFQDTSWLYMVPPHPTVRQLILDVPKPDWKYK